jgi:hypothetical protein
MERFYSEYPTLSIIYKIFRIVGVISLVLALIQLVLGLLLIGRYTSLLNVGGIELLISAMSTGLASLVLFAYAEMIKLFIRIEINTRKEDKMVVDQSRDNQNNPQKENAYIKQKSYEDWKKDKPSGTLNDYYAAMKE